MFYCISLPKRSEMLILYARRFKRNNFMYLLSETSARNVSADSLCLAIIEDCTLERICHPSEITLLQANKNILTFHS